MVNVNTGQFIVLFQVLYQDTHVGEPESRLLRTEESERQQSQLLYPP